uniref:Uncharacterized protein n=1 Tax=Arundo donax TaxID=35708 RepID=A0A0A9BIP3_ARUDO
MAPPPPPPRLPLAPGPRWHLRIDGPRDGRLPLRGAPAAVREAGPVARRRQVPLALPAVGRRPPDERRGCGPAPVPCPALGSGRHPRWPQGRRHPC